MLNLVPQATWELFQPKLGKQKIKALLNQKKKNDIKPTTLEKEIKIYINPQLSQSESTVIQPLFTPRVLMWCQNTIKSNPINQIYT